MIQTTTRRDFLKAGGMLALTAAPIRFRATPLSAARIEHLTRVLGTAPADAALPLPPLQVIALNRMAFGARPRDLDAFRALPGSTPEDKLRAYVELQLNPAQVDDRACDARLAQFETLRKPLEQLWADHVVKNPYTDKDADKEWEWRMRPAYETRAATLIRAAHSQRQLVEVLADFWHNHFNVYGWDDNTAPVLPHYDRDVIRAHLFGNFRRMLEAVATSPAMLYYLDNATNSNAGPNENYARELFELHTLGVENYLGVRGPASVPGFDEHRSIGYVDNDVFEAARAFTGWRVNDDSEETFQNIGTFIYHKPWHDRFNKIVLGKYLPHDQADLKDGRDVLDLVAFHPGTARCLARKLCQRLIGDNPPDRIVNEAAQVFVTKKDAPDQLKQVTRTILLSEEFRATWGGKIKRPFEAAVSMLRALDVEMSTAPDALFEYYDAMGQPLFAHTAPNGYPDHRAAWANTMSMLYRWKLANALMDGETELQVNLAAQMPANIRTPNAIVDFWIHRILGRAMYPESNRSELVSFVAQRASADAALARDQIAERLPLLVELIVMSPDFQWR